MTREDVVTLLKVNGDAFLSEAKAAGVEPEGLFGVWLDSLHNGLRRFSQLATAMVERPKGLGPEEEERHAEEISRIRAAAVQMATAAALMLECMPTPRDGEGLYTCASATGILGEPEKLN